MNSRWSTRLKVLVACGVFAGCILAANSADAQRFRRRWVEVYPAYPARVEPVPVQAEPVQPTPAQPAPAAAPAAQIPPSVGGMPTLPAPAAAGSVGVAAGRLIRGHDLIGMTIWGTNSVQLGTIRDFVVDVEGDCPHLFFAMAPAIAGWSEGYVIVPFDALQVGYDQRLRRDSLILGVTIENLRIAPHLDIQRWNSLSDRQFLTGAMQFYQKVERTAARPGWNEGREGRRQPEGQMRQGLEGQGKTFAPPQGRSPSGTMPGAQPGIQPPPQPSPPATSPQTAPAKPGSAPGKPESAPGKPGAESESGVEPQSSPPTSPQPAPPRAGSAPGRPETQGESGVRPQKSPPASSPQTEPAKPGSGTSKPEPEYGR